MAVLFDGPCLAAPGMGFFCSDRFILLIEKDPEDNSMKPKKTTKKNLPFTCPVCGRGTEYPVEEMVEGAVLTCPFCKLSLTLHGHMLEDVRREIKKLEDLA
jgi:hypothetical protein